MTNTIVSSILIIFITIGLETIGCKINYYFLKDKKNFHINLIYGIAFLSFLLVILFNLSLLNINFIIIFLLIIAFFKLFNFNFYKKFYKFCSRDFLITLLILILFLSTFKSTNYNNGDDLSGYFFTISKYINGRDIIKNNLHENFREYYISSLPLINAIFVNLSNFYSTNFFDRFYGLFLTILTINNILKNNYKLKIFLIILSLLSILTINETSSGKLIIVPFTLIVFLKLENFFYNNDEKNILQILFLSLSLFMMKSISIISVTNILFSLILIFKIYKSEIYLKTLIKNLFFLISFVFLYSIHNFNINFSFVPSILMDSEFHYTNNDYAKQIFLTFNNRQSFFDFFNTRHNYLIVVLTVAFLLFSKKNKIKFNLLLLSSLLIFQFSISVTLYPDNYNQLRYSLPFYQSLFIYLSLNYITNLKLDSFARYSTTLIIFLFIATRINLNIVNNTKLIFADLLFYFEKQSTQNLSDKKYLDTNFIYDYNYQNNLNSILKYVDNNDNNLLLISRPYLINRDFFNSKNLTYVEKGTGFMLSDLPYPVDGTIKEKSIFFKKKSINYIVFEKKITNNFDKKNLNNYFKNNHLASVAHKLFYSDLLETVEKINKIKIIENDDFVIWRLL